MTGVAKPGPGVGLLISRASVRDNALNPQEREVYERNAALFRALRRDGQPNPEELAALRPQGCRLSPVDRVSRSREVLVRNGWTVEIAGHPLRARLEATHPSGAAVMITADMRRPDDRIKMYLLRPPGRGHWQRLRAGMLPLAAERPERCGVTMGRPESKCRCGKAKYPTAIRAAEELDRARAKRLAKGQQRTEKRYYRCEYDDRAWHLTSMEDDWEPEIPLAGAWGDTSLPSTDGNGKTTEREKGKAMERGKMQVRGCAA